MRIHCLTLTVVLVSAALVSGQILQHVTVQFGDNLTLSCDYKAHMDLIITAGPHNVSWESMGHEVVRYDGNLSIGPLFGHRAFAEWVDWKLSFTLSPAVLSDSDIYECLWNGQKNLCTAIVTVLDDSSENFPISHVVGGDLRLPCFGKISRGRTLEKVSVYWKKDGEIIYSLIEGKPTYTRIDTYMDLDEILKYGDLGLYMDNLSHEDSGTYECLYRDNSFGEEVHGSPKFITLTVDDSVVDPTMIDPFFINGTSTMGILTSTEHDVTEVDLQTTEHSPEMPPSSVPETSPDTGETVPWVLIGIICGVLIITALILGPLVAMGKI